MMGDPDDPVGRALDDLDESWEDEINAHPTADDRGGAADRVGNDRTIAGLGIGTPLPMPVAVAPSSTSSAEKTPSGARNPFAHLQPRPRKATQEPKHELVQPEQSPLSFVLRASEPSVAPQKEASHDMSMFVDGLVAATSPVVEAEPAGTAMEPVMRRTRKRRQWVVACAIAATAIAGTVLGMHFAGGDDPPKIAANEAPAPEATPPADVEPSNQAAAIAQTETTTVPAAPTAAAPTAPQAVTEVEPAPAEPPPPVTEVATPTVTPTVKPVVAASTTIAKTRPATKPATKTSAKTGTKAPPKKVATAKPTAKPSAKKAPPKKPAIAKKAVAKKPAPAKKATKPTTAKKKRK